MLVPVVSPAQPRSYKALSLCSACCRLQSVIVDDACMSDAYIAWQMQYLFVQMHA